MPGCGRPRRGSRASKSASDPARSAARRSAGGRGGVLKINPNIFREYDIRGLADEELTDEVALAVARAYGTLMQREGRRRIALGRDVRDSSPRLCAAFTKGLTGCGLTVVDLGIVPTPVLYYGIVKLDADGGVQITGSHNPIAYNGFKLCRGTSSVWGDEIRKLHEMIRAEDFEAGEGGRESHEILSDYVDMVVSKTKPARPLKVVIDAGNGTGGLTAPEIFRALGHELTTLYCEPDGRFPNHQPDPTVEAYMEDLKAKVLEARADVGIGYDGDADRIGAVDERGRMVWGDQLLALYARDVLTRRTGAKIIFDVKCSQGLEEDIRAHGGVPIMWKTGHSLTKAKMREEEAPVAGEMSGHMFFAEDFFGYDDAVYASARLAALLSRQDRSLSELVDSLPSYLSSPEIRVECSDDDKFRIVKEVAEDFGRDHEVITIDGGRVMFGDGWGLIRASNTQPVLVLRFEARTPERLDEIRRAFRVRLDRYPQVKWD
ncbi:MAG: phosphomannomutase [Candidatus Eisenbacteria bacterium]|nr:phosphomannomutase [Candidatus Eisenbacteria bacterium]